MAGGNEGAAPDDVNALLQQQVEAVADIEQAAQEDSDMAFAALKQKYLPQVRTLDEQMAAQWDGMHYASYVFGAPVTELHVYYSDSAAKKEAELTLVNSEL